MNNNWKNAFIEYLLKREEKRKTGKKTIEAIRANYSKKSFDDIKNLHPKLHIKFIQTNPKIDTRDEINSRISDCLEDLWREQYLTTAQTVELRRINKILIYSDIF